MIPARVVPHALAEHCTSGAYRDLLHYHGLDLGAGPVSEGMVFGLGGGLAFLACDFQSFLLPPAPSWLVVGRAIDLEQALCDNLGIELTVQETDDPSLGWEWVRAEIDDGHPALVMLDAYHLDYLDVPRHQTRHTVVVADYDLDARQVLVADMLKPTLQWCSMQSFGTARASTGFPVPCRHTTLICRFPERLPEPVDVIAPAVSRAVANMRTEASTAPGAIATGSENPTVHGLEGIRWLAAEFPSFDDRFGKLLSRVLVDLHTHIRVAGTAGSLLRALHADFLRDAAELLGSELLRDASDIYAEAAMHWAAFGDAVVSHLAVASGSDQPNADRLAEHRWLYLNWDPEEHGLEHLRRLDHLEHSGVEVMTQWLDTVPRAGAPFAA